MKYDLEKWNLRPMPRQLKKGRDKTLRCSFPEKEYCVDLAPLSRGTSAMYYSWTGAPKGRNLETWNGKTGCYSASDDCLQSQQS